MSTVLEETKERRDTFLSPPYRNRNTGQVRVFNLFSCFLVLRDYRVSRVRTDFLQKKNLW